jgi:hypothetical protein
MQPIGCNAQEEVALKSAVLGFVHCLGDLPAHRLQPRLFGLLGCLCFGFCRLQAHRFGVATFQAGRCFAHARLRTHIGAGIRRKLTRHHIGRQVRYRLIVAKRWAVILMRRLWRRALGHRASGGILTEDRLAFQHAGATGGGAADRQGWVEIIRQAFALILAGGVQQPHQQEKSHHRGDKIRIGDLPGAAMMTAAVNDLLSLDDDRADFAGGGHRRLRSA